MSFIFWSCLGACLYIFVGYPLLVKLVGAFYRRPVIKRDIAPVVSVIIAAHNEEQVIAEKLDNLLGSDYPAGRLEILVASDGSTDATETIVGRYAPQGVRLLILTRCGKLMALNQAVANAQGEILVFTDANTFFEPYAVRRLVSNFADPEVGGVCGNKQYRRMRSGDSAGAGETLYWTYDKRLK